MSDLALAADTARAAGALLRDAFRDVSRLEISTKSTPTDLVPPMDRNGNVKASSPL